MEEKEQLLERFDQFCSGLSRHDRIAIVHHSDADGICSALIAAKAVEKLTGKKPVVVQRFEYGNRALGLKALKSIKEKKANVLIVLDLGIDGQPYNIEERYPFEKGLVIDHHKMYKDLNSEKTVFLKSRFFTEKEPSSYVTSKFAFDLFNRITDLQEFDWIACIGILGDMNLKHWKKFVQETVKKRKLSMDQLYRVLDLIAAVEVLGGDKMVDLFWLFYKAENPSQLLKSPFQKYLKEFKEEKDSLVEGFEEKAEYFPAIELYLYSIRAKHENIKSYVINEISEMHPDKTIILIQYLGRGRIRFSARRLDGKVKVNDLLVEAVKGIPKGRAGGHAPAAAGSILKPFLGKFKKRVLEILEEKYRK